MANWDCQFSGKYLVGKHGTAMVTKYVGSYADSTIGLIHMKREICRCC